MSNEPQEVVEGTLSEATLAYQNDPLKLLTHDMITRMTKYVAGEIQASAEDYVLLEQLTLAAAGRYEDLSAKGQKMFELFVVRYLVLVCFINLIKLLVSHVLTLHVHLL